MWALEKSWDFLTSSVTKAHSSHTFLHLNQMIYDLNCYRQKSSIISWIVITELDCNFRYTDISSNKNSLKIVENYLFISQIWQTIKFNVSLNLFMQFISRHLNAYCSPDVNIREWEYGCEGILTFLPKKVLV